MDDRQSATAGGVADRPEEWRPVPAWPEYEVSDLGRVRSLRPAARHGGQTPYLLAITRSGRGHGYVTLTRSALDRSRCRVARLVLQAFIGDCPKGHEAAYRDGDPGNLTLRNLYWAERGSRRRAWAARGEEHWNATLTEDQVRAIRREAQHDSIAEVARRHKLTAPHVRDIVERRLWTHLP